MADKGILMQWGPAAFSPVDFDASQWLFGFKDSPFSSSGADIAASGTHTVYRKYDMIENSLELKKWGSKILVRKAKLFNLIDLFDDLINDCVKGCDKCQ